MMKTIKRNFIYNASYQILIIILPIITAPYVSRVLGPSRMGQYSYSYSIATYFLLLAKLGFDNYGNRTVARNKSESDSLNKSFSGIYYLQIFISCISILFYVLYSFYFSKYTTLSLIQGLWVLGALLDINWLFFGLEEFSIVVLRNTIVKVISVILIFVFVREQEDLWKYALILSAGSVIGFAVTWPFIFKRIKFVRVTYKEIFSHFKQTLVLFIPVIAISVFTVLDKIMLGYLSSFAQVGYFEAAEKVMMAPKGIIGALGTVMLPRMASLYSEKDNKNKTLFINISIGIALIFSIGCMFGIIGISKSFVPIFFGDKYLPTIAILSVMSIVLPFYAIGNVVRTQMLIPNMRDRPYVISVIAGAVINVILNYTLIPKLGANGSVIATLIAEIVIAVVQLLAVVSELRVKIFFPVLLNSFISSILMIVIMKFIPLFVNNNFVDLVLQIILGLLVFLVTFIILSKNSKNEILVLVLKNLKLHK